MRARAHVRRPPAAPDWPPSLPAQIERGRTVARPGRRRLALLLAALAVVLAASLAVLGLVAGTRAAAQPDDLGRLTQTSVVVE